jgi:hypothetical protein
VEAVADEDLTQITLQQLLDELRGVRDTPQLVYTAQQPEVRSPCACPPALPLSLQFQYVLHPGTEHQGAARRCRCSQTSHPGLLPSWCFSALAKCCTSVHEYALRRRRN